MQSTSSPTVLLLVTLQASLPPERPSSPAHSYNSVEDTDADLTDDDSAALTPLSPNTLVRYEHPDGIAVSTSTDSIAGLIAPRLAPQLHNL